MARRKKKAVDPWREQLNELELDFCNSFDCPLLALVVLESDDGSGLFSAFNRGEGGMVGLQVAIEVLENEVMDIDPVGSISNAKATLGEIESWLRKQADVFLGSVAASARSKMLRKRLPRGWLTTAMQSHLSATQTALEQIQDAANEYLKFFQKKNSGLGAAFRRISEMWMDPDEMGGIDYVLGRGFSDREAKRLYKNLRKVSTQFEKIVETVDEALDELIVTKWNTEVITLAEDEE